MLLTDHLSFVGGGALQPGFKLAQIAWDSKSWWENLAGDTILRSSPGKLEITNNDCRCYPAGKPAAFFASLLSTDVV
jgi:hypothetical protein